MTTDFEPNDTASSEEPAGPASIRIVSGHPSDIEIAALVTVLAGASGSTGAAGAPAIRDDWGHPSTMHRSTRAFSPLAFGGDLHTRG